MTEKLGVAVLGGDKRQIVMARSLAESGYPGWVWGLGDCQTELGDAILCGSWETAVRNAEYIVLPLPASADGVRVSCPLHDPDVFLRLTTLLDGIGGKRLFGGRLTEPMRNVADQKGVEWFDYFDSEVLQLKNALPSAEGAISVAMQELPVTLHGASAVVVGYGRIGSLLAERLRALGADVTVWARRAEQLTLAELHGHGAVRLICQNGKTVPQRIPHGCRVIFNTVPHRFLIREILEQLSLDCLLIDLASAPGGIDFQAAEALGLRAVWATALPGKYAPESAGRFLAETLISIWEDL